MFDLKSRHLHIYETIFHSLVENKNVSNLVFSTEPPYFFYESAYSPYGGAGLFDSLAEEDAANLLHFFCSPEWTSESIAWNINIEMAKLLAKQGALVGDEVERLIKFHYERETCFSDACFLYLAYLGTNTKFEDLCLELLEKSMEDSRDGIFIACFSLATPRIKLGLEHFFKGLIEGTGEGLSEEAEAFSYFRSLFHVSLPNKS